MMFWKKPELPDIQFLDIKRVSYQVHPIVPAKEVPTYFQETQIKNQGRFRWADCPGMIDFKNFGYIVPAWDDIHIIANRAGVKVFVGGKRGNAFDTPKMMDANICDSIVTPEDNVPLAAVNCHSPWVAMVNNKKISAAVLPATYHSPFLDDLYVYPGLVDYSGNFSSLNFIFSPKRECKLTIPAGTPLLQVLPFEVRHIKAGYGPADDYQKDKSQSMISTVSQFYRKHYQQRKPTTISLNP